LKVDQVDFRFSTLGVLPLYRDQRGVVAIIS